MLIIYLAAVFAVASGGRDVRTAGGFAARPRAAGYSTSVHSPVAAVGGAGIPQGVNSVGGFIGGGAADFNPELLSGVRGFPGVKLRVNPRAFQYASTVVAGVLDSEIKRARIPPISQCLPQVNGCINIYNLYVSRYRCAQRVTVYPTPPNRVSLAIQNLDIGISGNLGGQITVLLPLALTGIVHANAHQVSITVQLTVERSSTGAPFVRVVGCSATVGYVDAYIENGGLIGDIVNNQFRSKVSEQVRSMIPSKLCEMLPQVVNEKVNPRLAAIPQAIPLTQIASFASGALAGTSNTPAHCLAQACQGQRSALPAAPQPALASQGMTAAPLAAPLAAPPPNPPAPNAAAVASPPEAMRGNLAPRATAPVQQNSISSSSGYRKTRRIYSAPRAAPQATAIDRRFVRSKRMVPRASPLPPTVLQPQRRAVGVVSQRSHQVSTRAIAPRALGTGSVAFADGNQCSGCPGVSNSQDPLSALQDMLKVLDISKLSDMYLTTQIVNSIATPNDFTVDLNGEFSPGAISGSAPFGAFPMFFPQPIGDRMAEVLISDFTLNSLFLHMHRKGFISFRIGPETPKIGDLLKTSCSDDEDDEDFGVELDDEEEASTTVATKVQRRRRQKRQDDAETTTTDDDEGGLADLGICFGDIVPAIREKYPNKKLYIMIRSKRAPSVILSSKNGGTATIDLMADAEIFIDGTAEKVGTISITAVVDVTVQSAGTQLTGTADLKVLKLKDNEQTLGLPQDALDNLANLGKEMLAKVANDALAKGIALQMPTTNLPVTFVNPQFGIVEHALHISSDIIVSSSLLGGSSSGGCRRRRY